MVEASVSKSKYQKFEFQPYNPGPSFESYLTRFNHEREIELRKRLADNENQYTTDGESLEICNEADLHQRKSYIKSSKSSDEEELSLEKLMNLGVFPSGQMHSVRIEFETYSFPHPILLKNENGVEVDARVHHDTKVVRVCSEHMEQIPVRGVKRIISVEEGNEKQLSGPSIPLAIYKAFDLPESPYIK